MASILPSLFWHRVSHEFPEGKKNAIGIRSGFVLLRPSDGVELDQNGSPIVPATVTVN
jgi:hypothetical protein